MQYFIVCYMIIELIECGLARWCRTISTHESLKQIEYKKNRVFRSFFFKDLNDRKWQFNKKVKASLFILKQDFFDDDDEIEEDEGINNTNS